MMNSPFVFEAEITSLKRLSEQAGGEDAIEVQFSPNNLYAGGGGQPCDRGYAVWKSGAGEKRAEIMECRKSGEGKIVILKGGVATLEQGTHISVHIDEERRMQLTKSHSGEHVLFKSIQTVLEQKKKTIGVKKVDLDVTESSLFVIVKDLSWDDLLEAELLANKIVRENLPTIEHHISREEFVREQHGKYKDIRIKLDRINESTIRIMEVKDFDYSACAGTHVHSTREIGNIFITAFSSSGNDEYEIRFKVDTDEALKTAGIARKIASELKINMDMAFDRVEHMKRDAESAKEKSRQQQKEQVLELAKTQVGQVSLCSGNFSYDDKKILIEKISSQLQPGEICVAGNSVAEGSLQLYFFSKNPAIPANALLKGLQQHVLVKGGGGNDFAAGAVTGMTFEDVLKVIKEQGINV